MNKRLLIALIAICLGANLTGCASGGSSEDGEVAEANDETFAEEGEGDFADEESTDEEFTDESTAVADDSGGDLSEDSSEMADSGEVPPDDEGGDLDLGDDTAVAEGEAMPSDEGDLMEEGAPVQTADAGSTGGEEELSLDDGELPDDVASTEDPGVDSLAAAPPPTDEPLFSSESSTPEEETQVVDSAAPVEEPPAAPSEIASSSPRVSAPAVYAPYLKIKDSAFTAADGTTLNRVYLARPKDNVKSVSEKLYGSDRSKDLRKWNPILSRGVRVGDKIYYSSPSNPSDNRMLTYYEEAGVQPQTYVSKEGDNIRTVATNLLGHRDSWKEVWATNFNVESKGNIPPGLELRYWTEMPVSAPVLASNNLGQPTDPSQMAPPPTDPLMQPEQIATNPALPNPDPLAPPPPTGDPLAAAPPNGDPLAPPQDPNSSNQASTDPLAPPPLPNDPMAPPPTDPNAVAGTMSPPPDLQQPPPSDPPAQPSEVKPVAKRPPPVVDEGMDENTMMAMGLGAILLFAAAGIFVFVRKNRARKMDLTQTTQV